MLVLTRRIGEEIIIGDNIRVTVISVAGERVRIGIDAPKSVSVDRKEVHDRRFHANVDMSCIVEVANPWALKA